MPDPLPRTDPMDPYDTLEHREAQYGRDGDEDAPCIVCGAELGYRPFLDQPHDMEKHAAYRAAALARVLDLLERWEHRVPPEEEHDPRNIVRAIFAQPDSAAHSPTPASPPETRSAKP